MKKYMVMLLVLLVAGNVHAGLTDKIGELLGIEPESTVAAPMGIGSPEEVPQEIAVWLLGTPTELDNPDAELSGRLGWRNDDTEFGAQVDVIGLHGDNHGSVGVYGLLWLGETYAGYVASIDEENRSFGPVAGTVIGGVVLEYRYRDFDDSPLDNAKDRHQVYAGLRIAF